MPTYEYGCNECGMHFEEFRLISERRNPIECPACASLDTHLLLSVPQMHIMTGEGSDSARRKEKEDAKIRRVSNRAKHLKNSGQVPMEEKILMNDPRVQD